jgi:hypothetical protein
MITLAAAGTLQGVAGTASVISYTAVGLESSTGEVYKVLGQGLLAASVGAMYTVPGSTTGFVKDIFLNNSSASPVACSIYINGTGASNKIYAFTIPANGSASFDAAGWKVYDSAGYPQHVGTTGPQGLKGLNWQGAYAGGTTYAIDDAVYYATTGSSYRSLQNGNQGHTPPAVNDAYWYALAIKGDTGLTGNTGPAGEVPNARTISTTAPLTGGGDLSANRTLALTTSPTGQTPVGVTRSLTATAPITGGGDLSADRSFGLAADGVLNTHLAPMPTKTIKGNTTGSTAGPTDLTQAEFNKLMRAFSTTFSANAEGILPGNTGAQNVTAFNAWFATAPLFSTLIVEPGFYDFAGELTLNRDIRLRVLGHGKGRSILRSTSTTANLFNQTVAGYYISFEELGFGATVTKTAGSAIRFAADNAITDVRRCEFQAQFQAIELVANTAMNVGVINECLFSAPASTAGTNTTGFQIGINGSNINMMVQNCTINVTGVSTTGMMINQCGAVQVGNCDFIGGKNTLLVNATAVVSALYFTSVFFDQATLGSTVKFMGTAAISRTKFVQCGITNGGGSGLVACEIAGTGTGTGIPEAIDFDLCDFYNNGFAGTTTGLLVTGVRGFDIRNSRISGFTFGLDITPYNGNGITNFGISGSTIGPTENFAGNGTGIRLNVGSFQFGPCHLTNNDLSGNTTSPLVNNGTFTTSGGLILRGNIGLVGEPMPLIAQPANPAAVETIYVQVPFAANSLQPGTTIYFNAYGTITATVPTLLGKIHAGAAGTTADAIVAALAATGITTATAWQVEAFFTVRTIGAAGAVIGNVVLTGTTPARTTQTATVALNTTVAGFISLSLQAGGTTPVLNIVQAYAQVIRQ